MDWSNINPMADAWAWYARNRENLTPIGALLGAVVLGWAALRQAGIAARRHYAQTEADRQRRVTESYSKAVEQLSSEKIEQRLGGIYTLERISRESPDDYWTIMETLTAFVRERARWTEPDPDATGEEIAHFYELVESESMRFGAPPTDIAAVLTVIKRRGDAAREREKKEGWKLDLNGCDLRKADLRGAHLERADLGRAQLERAYLQEAHLEDADLSAAHLERARLERADLGGAHLKNAYLSWAHLERADLGGAHLEGAIGLTQEQLDLAYGENVKLDPGLTIKPCPQTSGCEFGG